MLWALSLIPQHEAIFHSLNATLAYYQKKKITLINELKKHFDATSLSSDSNPTRGLKIVLRDGRSSVGVYKIGNGTRQGTVINIALACNLICVNWQQCVVVCASVTDFGNQ